MLKAMNKSPMNSRSLLVLSAASLLNIVVATGALAELGVSRRMANNNNNDQNEENFDLSFISYYSLKYVGCHLVTQFDGNSNSNSSGVDFVSLARFRLCPQATCDDDVDEGCTSNYGDYILSAGTAMGVYMKYGEDYSNSDFDTFSYLKCSPYTYTIYDNNSYSYYSNSSNSTSPSSSNYTVYVGPYCTGDGGSIKLGVFYDSSCTNQISDGVTKFYQINGFALPYSEESILPEGTCMSCYNQENLCTRMYQQAGKCEQKMELDYPNDSACGYIGGLTSMGGFMKNRFRDGNNQTATIVIEVLAVLGAFLGLYVYCLKSKLDQAKRNLLLSN